MTLPLTSYCKKCGQDVPVSSFCPNCRSKLAANTVRLAWCVEHHPVRDWMCWNAVMRLLLPVLGATLVLVILLEAVFGGLNGVAMLLGGGLLVSLAGIMGMVLALMLLVFILQGDDLLDCVIDSRGIHVQQYLPSPTAMKLLLRENPPADGRQRRSAAAFLPGDRLEGHPARAALAGEGHDPLLRPQVVDARKPALLPLHLGGRAVLHPRQNRQKEGCHPAGRMSAKRPCQSEIRPAHAVTPADL